MYNMVVTEKIILQGKSFNGGWSAKQIELLGDVPFVSGWKKRVIGKDLPEQTIKQFLDLKDKHLQPYDAKRVDEEMMKNIFGI